MATKTFTFKMLYGQRGEGTRGVPEILAGGGGETKFVMEVTIPSDAFVFRFDMVTYSVANNMNIDWGDSSSDSGVTVDIDHTYATAGVYDIKVDGVGNFNPAGLSTAQKDCVTNVKNWGNSDFEFTSLYQGFLYCNYINYTATDYPNLSNLATLGNAPKMDSSFRPNSVTAPLKNLDFSSWIDTDKFTSHNYAFYYNYNGTLLDLTGWDFSNSLQMVSLCSYFGNSKLPSEVTIKIPNITFNSALTYNKVSSLFRNSNCDDFDVPILDFSNVLATNVAVSGMFLHSKLSKLVSGKKTLDISTWTGTDKWIKVDTMFYGCTVVEKLNITNIDWSNVNSHVYLFRDMLKVEEIVGLNEFIPNATVVSNANLYMFYQCKELKFSGTANNLDVNFGSTWNNAPLSLTLMFSQVGRDLTPGNEGDLPNLFNANTSTVTSMNKMFYLAKFNSSLAPIVENFDMSGLTGQGLNEIMRSTSKTTTLDGTNWNITSALTQMNSTWRGCADLTSILFHSSSDFSGITTWTHCFFGSNALTSIFFPLNMSFASVTVMTNFMSGSMTTGQYDIFLLLFDATNSNSGMTLTMGASTYTGGGGAATARANIIARGNTITDGGIA